VDACARGLPGVIKEAIMNDGVRAWPAFHPARQTVACLCLVAVVALTGCLYRNTQYEEWSPNIRGTSFRTIATVAGTDYGADIRLEVDLRRQLSDAGWRAVPRSGRWDSVQSAVSDICRPATDERVDGVLFVSYDHLVLYECQSEQKAYDIRISPKAGSVSFPDIAKRLMRYLRGKSQAPLPRH
jgi:hypothetical protein